MSAKIGLIAPVLLAALMLAPEVAPADDPGDWPMYNHDPEGTRTNPAERRLRPDNVAGLRVNWPLATPGKISGTPAVVDDTIYSGDTTGTVYAVSRRGTLRWKTQVGASVTDSILVTRGRLVFGDQGGFLYGLDA